MRSTCGNRRRWWIFSWKCGGLLSIEKVDGVNHWVCEFGCPSERVPGFKPPPSPPPPSDVIAYTSPEEAMKATLASIGYSPELLDLMRAQDEFERDSILMRRVAGTLGKPPNAYLV